MKTSSVRINKPLLWCLLCFKTEFTEFNNNNYSYSPFRDEKNDCERCYFQNIKDFNHMVENIGKKSFNELDLLAGGKAIKVSGVKKRIHYRWDISKLLDDINNTIDE